MSGDPRSVALEAPSVASRIGRQVAWLVLVLIALLLFIGTGGYDTMGTIQSRIAHQVMTYLTLGTWLLVALARPGWRPRTPLIPFIAVAVGAYLLSTLASQRPRLSLEPGLAGPALALVYVFIATVLSDRWFRRRFAVLLVTVVGLVAVAYIVAVGFEWAVFYRLVRQITLPPLRPSWTDLRFGSPNLVATFLLVLGPLTVAILARMTRRRWPLALLAAAIAVAVFLTGSRGAFLGAGLGTVVLIGLLAWRRDWRTDLSWIAQSIRQRPVLLVPAALVVLAAVITAPLILYRFAQGGDSLRLDLWRSALAIFLEHPLFGGGPGTWVQLKVEANPPGAANLILAHAHDLYLQIAAELGIVGLVALALLGLVIMRRLLVGVRHANLRLESIAATAGLVAFLGQSLVDNLVNLPYVCVLIMLPLAWVDGGLLEADPRSAPAVSGSGSPAGGGRPGRLRLSLESGLLVGLLASLVVVAPILGRINAAAAAESQGDRTLELDPAGALAAYERALAIDPDFMLYRIQRASALARLGRVGDARRDLEAAVALEPLGINLISLASLDLADGDSTAARDHIREALEQAPYEIAVALNAGLMAERLGDRELALQQLAISVALRPALAGLSILSEPSRLIQKADVITAARAISAPEDAALILAYAGDARGAQAELEARPPSRQRDVFLAVTRWLGGDAADAIRRLEPMVERNPLDYYSAAWLAGILSAERDPRAGKYLRLIRLVQDDAGPGIAQSVRAVTTTADKKPWFGLPGHYPWAVYIRASNGHLLAPDLTLVGTP